MVVLAGVTTSITTELGILAAALNLPKLACCPTVIVTPVMSIFIGLGVSAPGWLAYRNRSPGLLLKPAVADVLIAAPTESIDEPGVAVVEPLEIKTDPPMAVVLAPLALAR